MALRVPKIVTNFYVLTTLILLVWMILLDTNDFISQYRQRAKCMDLEDEKNFYKTKIIEVKESRDQLFGSISTLEKFAREKYLMKRPSEDVYIIKPKSE